MYLHTHTWKPGVCLVRTHIGDLLVQGQYTDRLRKLLSPKGGLPFMKSCTIHTPISGPLSPSLSWYIDLSSTDSLTQTFLRLITWFEWSKVSWHVGPSYTEILIPVVVESIFGSRTFIRLIPRFQWSKMQFGGSILSYRKCCVRWVNSHCIKAMVSTICTPICGPSSRGATRYMDLISSDMVAQVFENALWSGHCRSTKLLCPKSRFPFSGRL